MVSGDGQHDNAALPAAPVNSASLPRPVRVFWVASIVAILLTLLVSGLERHAGVQKLRWDPLSDPWMGDLKEYPGTYLLLHTSAFFDGRLPDKRMVDPFGAVAYPPFAAVVMAPGYLSGHPVGVFLGSSAAFLLAAWLAVRRTLLRAGIASWAAALFPLSLILISFPIQRLVHQGNVELVLWAFTVLGIWAFLRGRDEWAAVLWGLAAAMKLYPIVLLILLLPRGKYRAIAIGAAAFVGVSWLSLWWLGPSVAVAWQGSLHNVFGYQSLRASEWTLRELVANHSLFDLVKMGATMAHAPLGRLTLPYYGLCGTIFCAAFFGKLRRMPVENQLLAVTVFMVLLPTISYYHTLVQLYAPLLLLVLLAIRARDAGVRVRGLQGTMLLFVPLFVPFTLLTFPEKFVYCGMLQAVVLAILFLCSLEFPFNLTASESVNR
ncbi:MAG TPA: glycosyltransferase family 87 protein [Acidobacteriaceae bacterium]